MCPGLPAPTNELSLILANRAMLRDRVGFAELRSALAADEMRHGEKLAGMQLRLSKLKERPRMPCWSLQEGGTAYL